MTTACDDHRVRPMATLLVILLFVGLAVAYFLLNNEEDSTVKRCSRCGLRAVEEIYRGPVGGPAYFQCLQCGAEFRRQADGSLTPVL